MAIPLFHVDFIWEFHQVTVFPILFRYNIFKQVKLNEEGLKPIIGKQILAAGFQNFFATLL